VEKGKKMSISVRAAFLLVVAAVVLHLVPLGTFFIFAGYYFCTALDEWIVTRRAQKAIGKAVDYELGWEVDPQNPKSEIQGDLSHLRLPREEQIVVNRVVMAVGELLKAAL
jgi:hypothetical protein